MLEGIGIQTITATAATVGIGMTTPLDCYIGIAGSSASSTFDVAHPSGALGCQLDVGNFRFFAEHVSSPEKSNDYPGINHAGVKGLVDFGELTGYAGVSAALPSEQLNGSPILSQIGVETNDDFVRFYGEWIMSVDKPEEGMLSGGVKFMF